MWTAGIKNVKGGKEYKTIVCNGIIPAIMGKKLNLKAINPRE